MHNVWRAGGSSPEGITIPCQSESNAKRLRFALYNSVKAVKTGKFPADSALKKAITTCSLSFTDDKCGIRIRPKVATELSQTMIAVLGALAGKTTEDYMLEESFARMQEIVPGPKLAAPEGASNKSAIYGARGV